jgi:hypothetical protein
VPIRRETAARGREAHRAFGGRAAVQAQDTVVGRLYFKLHLFATVVII